MEIEKVKKFALKHGKKIGGAALTAIKQTASTFSPTKKVKVAYKAGKAVATGVKIAKPVVLKTIKKSQPALTATKTKVLQIARFPKQSAVNAFKKWLASSPYKYSKNTSTRKIKNVFSVNKNTQNLIMSTKNVKTGKWTKKKITSKEFSELK